MFVEQPLASPESSKHDTSGWEGLSGYRALLQINFYETLIKTLQLQKCFALEQENEGLL